MFFQNGGELPKEIEVIEVDGASDEGTMHEEVQFHHTERHLTKPTRVTAVSERCSGDSYLNDAERQNGWQSQAQANMFIPSTLTGPNVSAEGGFV